MSVVLSFGLTACVSEAEQVQIDKLVEKNTQLVKELDLAYEKHKAGKLTTQELSELTKAIQGNISETKAEVQRLKEKGVGWMELAGATALGILSRGLPSKGPLASVVGVLAARRRED
jgi:hypothetical protein